MSKPSAHAPLLGLATIATVSMTLLARPFAHGQSRAPIADGGVIVTDASLPLTSAEAGSSSDAARVANSLSGADDEPDPSGDHALGQPEDDLPDPIADEGERTGSVEGEPLPSSPQVAHEIAALSDRQCVRLLRRAGVAFEPSARAVLGVAQPIFVTGPIGGVSYRASGRRQIRELMDCRLAVTLVRWSRLLRALSIREVVHLSTYRPPSQSEAERTPVQSRHPGGMAIDAGSFVRDDGTVWSVLSDFHGRMRRPVCGPEARVPRNEAARYLRTIACDSARRGLFHVVLTPNFNRPHRNHLHLEVARGTSWQFVR
jgi:hypothetical protein